jgi:hypothetical protein
MAENQPHKAPAKKAAHSPEQRSAEQRTESDTDLHHRLSDGRPVDATAGQEKGLPDDHELAEGDETLKSQATEDLQGKDSAEAKAEARETAIVEDPVNDLTLHGGPPGINNPLKKAQMDPGRFGATPEESRKAAEEQKEKSKNK